VFEIEPYGRVKQMSGDGVLGPTFFADGAHVVRVVE